MDVFIPDIFKPYLNLEPAEMKLMMNMLKVAIHQEREFTSDESKNFNDLFVKIIEKTAKLGEL